MTLKIERKKLYFSTLKYGWCVEGCCVSKCLSLSVFLPGEGNCLCLVPRGIDGNLPPAQVELGKPLQGAGLEVFTPSFSPLWGSV